MKSSDFIFDCFHLLQYKCHKMNLNCGESQTDSPNQIKNKKVTINPVNDDGKCYQFVTTVALNQEEIGKHLQRIPKIKPFINKHNWKGINQPLKKNYRKKFKKTNPTFALNVLYTKKMNVSTYILKHNLIKLFF